MTEQAQGEAIAANTPRLVFDNSVTEDDIPAFLRKGKNKTPLREPGDEIPVNSPKEVVDFEESSIDASIKLPETEQVTKLVQTPAAMEDTPEIVSREEDHSEGHPGQSTEVGEPERTNATDGDGSIPNNLDEMSVEDLQRQQEEIDRKIREKRLAEKKAVIDQIVSVVNTYKIPVEELVEALGGMKVKRKGVKATQKYLDPKTGATWSGRGKEPTWIRGKNRDKFLIK